MKINTVPPATIAGTITQWVATNHPDKIDQGSAVAEQFTNDALTCQQASVDLRPNSVSDCADCAEPIAPARKAAAPFATRCVSCQQDHEQGIR